MYIYYYIYLLENNKIILHVLLIKYVHVPRRHNTRSLKAKST